MNEEMWQAIVDCDAAYDGLFYYGLITTGIFCKPSCKSKTPKQENVRIFASPAEAKATGLRPCKRCRPEEIAFRSPEEELVEGVTQLIHEHAHESLTLTEMAEKLFVSPFYLQKCFTRIKKVSPNRYLTLLRLEKAKSMLRQTDESITAIAFRIGFRNSAYFSSVFQKEIGCSPSAYRQMKKHPHEHGVEHV
ncbi:bifunctional transcriptional activator/DNA repair enzyme AdaA [Brevibacillus migulae]|uniref:bifunctional transcriptional activator/DNA repair enzyme AdaA n=1 Tax=Brevibacillus migulae TaxID=1644114 RepID=UPI00106E79FB|nr:Ada metal-binding domain-containing protein [Brevibacillus migulae]